MMRRRPVSGGARAVLCLALAAWLLAVLPPGTARAHPLGNFTINHYSEITFSDGAARVRYVLDFAEIPTFQRLRLLDADGDGALSEGEARAWLDAELPALVRNLDLEIGGSALPLRVADSSAALLPGQGGLKTLRVEARLDAELPEGWESAPGSYTDTNFDDRLGWREIVVRGGEAVAIKGSTVPSAGVSDELRSYPRDSLSSPLDHRAASFTLAPGSGAASGETVREAARGVRESTDGGGATDRVAALVAAGQLTPGVVLFSLLAAVFWGAAHALSPGHGKTVVAAYLIGARGTARHAIFLGLTVTATHTVGIFLLGLVTLYLSRYILPEDLYPWLNVLSGLLVVGIGVTLLVRRVRGLHYAEEHGHHHAHEHHGHDHDHHHTHAAHDHTHDHGGHHHHGTAHGEYMHTHGGHTHSHLPPGADGSKITLRSLLALGISGGLVPCPSALVLLLGAISLGRVGFGMVLVVAFSLGLAAVLTGIGLALVYARTLFDRFSFEARAPRYVPVASAAAISVAGVLIVAGALKQAGLV